MSTPAAVTAFYERLWNAGDLSVAEALLAEDFSFRSSLGLELRGREAFKDHVREIRQLHGDYRCEILECITEGDRAVARMRFGGIHKNFYRGYEPTGKLIHWNAAAFFHMRDGLIAELWVLGDVVGLDEMLKKNANRD